MIRFSALLVALAIGLLVAGVAASSLPLVYVSIAVCAAAALLLAAGVLRHWSEIFGTGTRRAASPFAATRPVPSLAAGRATVSQAVPGPGAVGRASAGSAAAGPPAAPASAGFQAEAGAGPVPGAPEPTVATGRAPRGDGPAAAQAGQPGLSQEDTDRANRGDRRPGRKGWPSRRPAEPEPAPAAAAEPIHAAPTDDLWDRVNEELESAGKRDSGRLSWPAGDFSIPSGMSLPSEPPGDETPGEPGPARGADLWQPAADWPPPTTPHSDWPFGPPAEPAAPPASEQPAASGTAAADTAAADTAVAAVAAPRPGPPTQTRPPVAFPPGMRPPGPAPPGYGQPGRCNPEQQCPEQQCPERRAVTVPGMKPTRTTGTRLRHGPSGCQPAQGPSPLWCPPRRWSPHRAGRRR